jgi:hypothetical protein
MADHTKGSITASQYLDDGRYGLLTQENEILVGVSAGLTEADAIRLASCWNACEGLTQDHFDGDWTAKGLSQYAKKLEGQVAELRAALQAQTSPGTPSARLAGVLAKLREIFPDAHDQFSASPPELAYLERVAALQAQQGEDRKVDDLCNTLDGFMSGVIAALGALAPHSKHGDVVHDEIVNSVGKEALYAAAEPDDVEWAGLDPDFYAAMLAARREG